jgi:hypothetical protein
LAARLVCQCIIIAARIRWWCLVWRR